MRQGPGGRRSRGRHHNNGNGGGASRSSGDNRPRSIAALRHHTFDSNGPDVRVRGNAWQVFEKYQALARDAASSGDHIAAENLLQHAEHYYRIIKAINEATAMEQRARGGGAQQPFGQQPDVPANYYMPDGQMPPMPSSAVPQPDGAAGAPQQAEVQRTAPAANAFFSPDDADDSMDKTPEPLLARR